MALRVNISADIKKATAFFNELDKRSISYGSSNALNVVIRTVRNETINEVADVRRVKRSLIRKAIEISKRAIYYELTTVLRAVGRVISLREYSARQSDRGVTVNVQGTPKLLTRAFGPGYGRGRFSQAKRLGGHVFERLTAARLPIKQLWGPSITTGFIKDQVRRVQRAAIARDWQRTMNQKLEEQLVKLRAKYGG